MEFLEQKLCLVALGRSRLGQVRGILLVPVLCVVFASQEQSLCKKTCPTTEPSTAACSCHHWRVSSVRSHQRDTCTARGQGAASPCVRRGPAGNLSPNFPVLFPEVMSCRKEFSFYRKLHKGTTRVLWFCLCIPKYTTFFLILYDLQLPYKNKLFAEE